jgi:hypothetical protein
MPHDIYSSRPGRLAALFTLDESGRDVWQPEELLHILAHQLSSPLVFDGSRLAAATEGEPLVSFRDLFRHPSPPLELLRLTKDFAKGSDERTEDPLPPEVATVLYYGAIAVALVRHGARISSLDDARLRDGIAWALDQPWVDPATTRVFVDAAIALGDRDRHGGEIPD